MVTPIVDDVHEAVEVFMASLNEIAKNHKRPQEYVRLLGSIGSLKKAKQRTTTPFGAFCSIKMAKDNHNKDKGDRTTLQEFLERYKFTKELQLEFGSWDNQELIRTFNDAKEEKESPPMRVVNISVSKTVLGRVENITSSCRDLNRQFGTEIAFFYCRGNPSHTYLPGSFASDGAKAWLENAEIGHNCADAVAQQLDGFTTSGIAKRVRRTKEGSARQEYKNSRTHCRQLIQGGLGTILGKEDISRTRTNMNYSHYEAKIVESLGVALVGWPLPSHVCNPGSLGSNDINTLMKALDRGVCKWIKLTPEEVTAWKIDNQHHAANGEQVYGPLWKQRARNAASHGGSNNNDDNDE